MARQGVSRLKGISGRLAGSGRGQTLKKRTAEKHTPSLDLASALYSPKTEDQVTSVRKGLDQCASILSELLEVEAAESKLKPQGAKTSTSTAPTRSLSRKPDSDKRKLVNGKKANLVKHNNKRPGPVHKPVLPASSCAGVTRQACNSGPKPRMVRASHNRPSGLLRLNQAEDGQQASHSLTASRPASRADPLSLDPIHPSTMFNSGFSQCSRKPRSNQNESVLVPCSEECLGKSGRCTGTDDKYDHDTVPVKDIRYLTTNPPNLPSNNPQITNQKVKMVWCLLEELKTVVGSQDDALRLISEVEQSIVSLPVMVGSTSIQDEIAHALQPLRSENVQLRRRVRTLSQKLSESERAEQQIRPENCSMEMVAVQSLNVMLQTQLNESREELNTLQRENLKLRRAAEERNSDGRHHEECGLSKSLADVQWNLEQSETEKATLTQCLQQRETEVSGLWEVGRNTQRSQTQDCYSSRTDLYPSNSPLTRSVLQIHTDSHKDASVSNKCSDAVNLYLQTLEEPKLFSSGSYTSQFNMPTKRSNGLESDAEVCKLKDYKPSLETIGETAALAEEEEETQQMPHCKPFSSDLERLKVATSRHDDADAHIDLKSMGLAFEELNLYEGFRTTHDEKFPEKFKSKREPMSRNLRTGQPSIMESTFSFSDVKSLVSEWSINSWSTFNTQDEQKFRDGLAALDASIESLQRTLKADRNKQAV